MLQNVFTFTAMTLSKAFSLCMRPHKNRAVFGAGLALVLIIAGTSIHRLPEHERFLKPNMGTANLEQLLEDTRINAIDLDPLTYQSLRKDILSLANGEDLLKNKFFRQFLKGEQRTAINNLIAHTEALSAKKRLKHWRQIAALSFYESYRTSEEHYQKIITQHERTPEITYQLAVTKMLLQKNEEASDLFLQFTNLPQTKGTAYEAASYGNLGIIALRKKNVQLAEYYILKSLQQNTILGRSKAIALQHANLGIVALNKGKGKSARLNFTRALKSFEELEELHNIARIHNTLGELELQANRQEQARQHFLESYRSYLALGDTAQAANQLTLLGRNAYVLGQKKIAREYYEESLRLNLLLNRPAVNMDLYTRLGLIHFEEKNPNQACHYWARALNFMTEDTKPEFRKQLLEWRNQLNCPSA